MNGTLDDLGDSNKDIFVRISINLLIFIVINNFNAHVGNIIDPKFHLSVMSMK
jgi:hypothetical protein